MGRRASKKEVSGALLVAEVLDVAPTLKKRRRGVPTSLGKVTVLSVPYEVVIAHPDDSDGKLTDDDHAVHDEEGARFILHEGRNFHGERTFGNVVHEVLHAWLEDSGADYYLASEIGKGNPSYNDDAHTLLVENLVRVLTPAVVSSIDDLTAVKKRLLKGAKR